MVNQSLPEMQVNIGSLGPSKLRSWWSA